MKALRLISLIGILGVFAACQTIEELEGIDNGDYTTEEVIVHATNEMDSQTKTVLKEDGSVWWNPEDAIGIFFGNICSKFVAYNMKDAPSANFIGNAIISTGHNEQSPGLDEYSYWAVYPYDPENTSRNQESLNVYLPSTQRAVAGTFDRNTFISIAQNNDYKEFSFYNLCGGLAFCVESEGIQTVTFKGNRGETLAGGVNVIMNKEGKPVVSEVLNGKSEITFQMDKGEYFIPGEWYYMTMLPAALSEGYTMEFMTDIKKAVMSSSSPVEIKRSVFGRLTNPDKKAEWGSKGLVDIEAVAYDGFTAHLNMPESVSGKTGPGTKAIRWAQSCIMTYNYLMANYTDYFLLLYNGSKHTTSDIDLEYSEETNWYESDMDEDGDGMPDLQNYWNPISPGEPIVFIAGEFSWMTSEDQTSYFEYPGNWDDGYYMPMLNPDYFTNGSYKPSGYLGIDYAHPMDAYWTGAFERKFFRAKEPSVLDAGVEVNLVDITPIDITLEFIPDEKVDRYVVEVLDDASYDYLMSLIDYNPDYLQWAVTSYFFAYNFGCKSISGPCKLNISSFFYETVPESTYHVLITSMGDTQGTSQSFQQYEFRTTAKQLPPPVIKVEAVEEETSPYKATFNIKCTTHRENPISKAYYTAAPVREWELLLNNGYTYYSLINGNIRFSSDEIARINSEEGLTVSIPSIDGETVRMAVLGFNTENTPNDVTSRRDILECAGPPMAEVTTPWAEPKPAIDPVHYETLVGDWTATATMIWGGSYYYSQNAKITISADLYDYPASLPSEVYVMYEQYGFDREEVDAMWVKFKQCARSFSQNRLMNQNRLICLGWFNEDSYSRLATRTPYDLFVAEDYHGVDAPSIFNDFGPKWYIEAVQDSRGNVSFVAPVDSKFLPPASNLGEPLYMAGYDLTNNSAITYGDDGDLCFPVRYDEENDRIIIEPFTYGGVAYFPNIIGEDYQWGAFIGDPVVSEVVLTRGWNSSDQLQQSVRTSDKNSAVKSDLPKIVYKQMTGFKERPQIQKVEYKMASIEEIKARSDEFVRRHYGIK